ncbi:tripartite motif-containing protein 67-like [Liolophura sinensis]|uniref:tripartite motif-containing protein 67-like n=1 Tax=Liolophura sinensis TaxID=3198878 RepID=UPI0031593459
MSENKQNLEEVLTCSVCVQMFREPVVLSCQHSFCKECIRSVAEKSKSGVTGEQTTCSPEGEDVRHVIHCPVCRAPISLGTDGVAGLPLNFQLAEIVERFSSDAKVEDNIIPHCAVCEEDNKSKAVKYCCYCRLLYCDDCLSAYHPMKGSLKQHRLITSEEHLSQGNMKDQEKNNSQLSTESTCDQHDQAMSLYCVTCRMLLCLGCVVEHPEHKVRDIVSATEKEKATFLDKTGGLEKSAKEIKRCLSGFKGIQNNIQENHDLHTKAIQSASSAALEALNSWKTSALETVKTRHSDWSVQCGASVKHLSILEEELERMQQASKDLLSSTDVKFLQGSKVLTERYVLSFSYFLPLSLFNQAFDKTSTTH